MKNLFSNVNGWDVEIHTGKNYNGVIACSAQFGTSKQERGYSTFEYDMFTDPNIVLAKSAPGTRATEKAIQTIHAAGLAKFEEMRAAGELPIKKSVFEIQVGQVLFLNGYGQDEHSHEKEAVYKIEGQTYFTVNMTTLALSAHNHVKPIEEKFGIGTYYKKGDTLPVEEVEAAVIKAIEKKEADNLAKIEADKAKTEEKELKILEGAKLLPSIPVGVTHVIVAELHENQSDPMTDYFNYKTIKTVFLAWSRHDRNMFDEMRKAAANSQDPEISELSENNSNLENRENYSGGAGMYLGQSKYSGWIIRKRPMPGLETLQIAAAEGRMSIPEEAPTTAAEDLGGDIAMIDYSEKAFIVRGEGTRAIKDDLRGLGGIFNFRLQGGPAWVFSKKNQDKVLNYLQGIKKRQDEVMSGLKDEYSKMQEFLEA